jgi:hypothetical protein
MTELTDLERAVLEKLLAGDDERLAELREQLETTLVSKREMTGVGFFTTLSVLSSTHRLNNRSLELGGVIGEIPTLTYGAGFLLFVRDGFLDVLEGFVYGDEPWPKTISRFELRYTRPGPRDLDALLSPNPL